MLLGMDLMTGVLAQDEPRQTGPDFGKASPVGLIVLLLLLVAVFFLVWSMNRHLRKLPNSFDGDDAPAGGVEPGAEPRGAATEGPADGTKRESSG